ncbi:MAG: SDR family oxidoreductase [Candidatus Delongbacteria bacterium]|nr:SDR family oxidoreductase [Candidatus Delongbacteria bacterium]MBN2834271.1 SDR family oxidoreductase [Candidatus Delongbacteria bacterium]
MNENNDKKNINIDECLELLEQLVENPDEFAKLPEDKRIALLIAAGRISRPNKKEDLQRQKEARKLRKKEKDQQNRIARASTGIRTAREVPVFVAPTQIEYNADSSERPKLTSPRNCYVCKDEFTDVHHFYDTMCPKCADFNYMKRFQTASLKGRVAVITGSRLKIGYHATLMLLRAGAKVIATTRFPVDSAMRFSKEADFFEWKDRLQIYGLDLRHTPSVELFCNYVEQHYDRLDILINNAAQTVRRPPGFYAHLMENETKDFSELDDNTRYLLGEYRDCVTKLITVAVKDENSGELLPVSWEGKSPGIGLRASAELSQIPYSYDYAIDTEKVFPVGKLDADLQQVDLRHTNSWRLRLGEIPTSEMLELQLVNAVAPFVLCNRLSNMMKRDYTGEKHIVNVSAMEGKFHRFTKIDRHPHTNMAKAALNMLTHTSASDLAKYGIYMNAVDTGWVTDEDPVHLAKLKEDLHDFQPPLDIVDGAARVCDPFFDGILTGKHWCGKFLKDYFPIDW